jgi:hypothetical protein
MAIFSECTVTNEAEAAILASIDSKIATGFKLVADTITAAAAPTKQPAQEIFPNGSLTIPYGTVALNNDGQNNVVWTNKNGTTESYGLAIEIFVVGSNLYLMGTDAIPYVVSTDRLGGWDSLPVRAYNDLKSCALKIVTANPVTPPSA